MEFCFSHIIAFLTLTLVARASYATAARDTTSTLPPQLHYWNSVLPGTTMPKALSELVQPDSVEPPKNFVGYNHHAVEDRTLVIYTKNDDTNLKDPTQRIFFLEKEIKSGTTMKYSLGRKIAGETFLPRKTAESIPFSSAKLPEILNKFSMKPGSVEAAVIQETIQDCESEVLRGEDRYCATSLESMVDFAMSKLGKNVQAISTEVEKGATLQNYTVKPGVKKVNEGGNFILCHKLTYAYAVFFCHTFGQTRAYAVPLQGADGRTANAVAICHLDTSAWNPKNHPLQEVKVKPGTVPVCHYLPQGHIAWVPN
ncbi:hypothetical protein CerSpe_048850 [Prunus speciosa]